MFRATTQTHCYTSLTGAEEGKHDVAAGREVGVLEESVAGDCTARRLSLPWLSSSFGVRMASRGMTLL